MAAAGPNGGDRPDRGTGASPPFEIVKLPIAAGGVIGLARLPGLVDGRRRRELLNPDLDTLAEWRTTAALCLADTEAEEVGADYLEQLSFELRSRNIGFLHLPVPVRGVPGAAFDEAWERLRDRLVGAVAGGKRLVVHCTNGRVRCTIVAARLLIDCGTDVDTAIEAVRAVSPGALDRNECERAVREYAGRR